MILLLAGTAFAQEARGFVEVRAQGYLGVDGEQVEVVERLRPEVTHAISERVSLSATVEAALSQGRSMQDEVERTFTESELGPFLAAAQCEWPTEQNETLGISEVGDYLSVDRLYADVYAPWADFRLGRQAIQWGSAFLVNPTDPFPQVIATQPWRPRAGVNALRVSIPVGELNQVQVVAGSDDVFEHARIAARGTLNAAGVDWSLLGAWRQESDSGLLGLDIRGTLGVGFWLEGAMHLAGEADPYEELAVGVDYSLPVLDNLILTGQYYRNGAGSRDGTNTIGALQTAVEGPECAGTEVFATSGGADPSFTPFFSGTDYAMGSAALSINPEIAVNTLYVQNLGDGTAYAVPVLSTYPTGALQVSLAAQLPMAVWGDGGELKPAREDLVLDLSDQGLPATVDLAGLVPDATLILWGRYNF